MPGGNALISAGQVVNYGYNAIKNTYHTSTAKSSLNDDQLNHRLKRGRKYRASNLKELGVQYNNNFQKVATQRGNVSKLLKHDGGFQRYMREQL